MDGRVDVLQGDNYEAFQKLIRSADSLLAGLMGEVKVEPEAQSTKVFQHKVSTLQSDVEVVGDKIYGTLKYCSTGSLATTWGAGYFLVLKFSEVDETATSVKVGLDPSEGSGLVELLGDPDMNGVFKITSPYGQKFKVVSTDGTRSTIQKFDLSGLVFEPIG